MQIVGKIDVYKRQAVAWGANVVVVETGSVPRDRCCFPKEKWNSFDVEQAAGWFQTEGFKVCSTAED